jgi:tetratricopeptide (TPR) repeat protein
MSDRLKNLLEFYEEDPNDPFNIYSLALEYSKSSPTKAKVFFDLLLLKHPTYVPTYYHAAKLLQETDQKEKAIEVYKKGMLMARNANDHKALRELQSAHDELVFE